MKQKRDGLFSPSWTALYLRCTKRALFYWEEQGKLHPVRINKRGDRRYKEKEIQTIIDENPWIWKPAIDSINKSIAAKKS